MRDLGDRLFFLCPFVSANGDDGGGGVRKKIIIMVERCRSLNVSSTRMKRFVIMCFLNVHDRMKNNRGFKRRSIFLRG